MIDSDKKEVGIFTFMHFFLSFYGEKVMRKSPIVFLLCLIQLFSCTMVSQKHSLDNGDWPQYRGDAGRCGYTPQNLSSDLTLEWKHEQKQPSPAWKGFHVRMAFAYAYEPVIAGKTLYFGSSSDCKLYAIDTETGEERWSFFTDAPIRFAPAVWKDRVFAVSDDGYLYCLDVKDGKLMWKKRGGSEDSFVLGNNHMVSRWPARGGVVIKDDILYFGAGIWPSDGIFIYALDPTCGKVLWVNDDSGDMEWDQPHPGARARSGISAQGYLVAAGERLIVPSGRAVPSALHLSNGALDYFHLMKYRSYGGSRVLATDNYLFITSGNKQDDMKDIIGKCHALFSTKTGELLTGNDINSQAIAITPDHVLYVDAHEDELKAIERDRLIDEIKGTDKDGNALTIANLNKPAWTSFPAGEFKEWFDSFPVGVGEFEETVPRLHLKGKHVVAIRVEGESMYPDVMPGDILYVDPDIPFIATRMGRIGVVRYDGGFKIRRIFLIDEGINYYLVPLNKTFEEEVIPVNETTVYKVVFRNPNDEGMF